MHSTSSNRSRTFSYFAALMIPAFFLLETALSSFFAVSQAAESLTIFTKADWEKWKWPPKSLNIEDGLVKSIYIRKNINACLNAPEFTVPDYGARLAYDDGKPGGIEKAGSNLADAPNVMDGDLNTWWAPDKGAEPRDWWLEIDLARVVSATKLRVVFSKEGKPVPFFKVFISSGVRFVYTSRTGWEEQSGVAYDLFEKNSKKNTEYVLEYDLPLMLIRYVRFVIVEQGENSGVAEIEVYSVGENMTLKAIEVGGSVSSVGSSPNAASSHVNAIDGDIRTGWDCYPNEAHGDVRTFYLDLGVVTWVDMIRLVMTPRIAYSTPGMLTWYRLDGSDGSWAPDGSLMYHRIASYSKTSEQKPIEHYFSPPKQLRYFRLDMPTNRPDCRSYIGPITWGVFLQEFQVFGEGYLPRITLESNIFDLGKSKNVTSVWRDADTPPGTRVEIKSRTGDEVKEVVHYYDKDGVEISYKKWKRTPKQYQGPTKTDVVPKGEWSPWSRKYLGSGGGFLSPNGKRYLQLKVDLVSELPSGAPELHSIRLVYTDPMARVLVGEISPALVRPGIPQEFSYYIRPSFAPGDLKFDTIRIMAPVEMEFIGAKVGGLSVDTEHSVSSDTLTVGFPSPVSRSTLVEIQFGSTILENGTLFEAFVGNRKALPGSWQKVEAGDATELVDSQTTTVSLPADTKVIENLSVSPQVITPNGDGANDEMGLEFDVLKVSVPRRVMVVVCDVRGVIVRRLLDGSGRVGHYTLSWAGEDDAGEMVTPGIYICSIKVKTDEKEVAISRVLTVVY